MVAVSIQQNTEQRAKDKARQRIHDKKYTAGKSQVDNFAVCTNETHDGSKAYCAQKTNEGNRQSRCFNKSAQAQRFDFHALAKTGHDSMNFSGKRYDNNCYGDYIAEIQRIDGIYFRQGDAEKRSDSRSERDTQGEIADTLAASAFRYDRSYFRSDYGRHHAVSSALHEAQNEQKHHVHDKMIAHGAQ